MTCYNIFVSVSELTLICKSVAVCAGCIEHYIHILDGKCKTKLLKTIYAGIHNRQEDDEDLQTFFKFKCWI